MASDNPKIIYTHTDESPAMATYSLLPILEAFSAPAGIQFESRDISLAGRIIAVFPDYLDETHRQPDDLGALGELAMTPEANIIKLPNISASMPQMVATIRELQQKGYALPDYPDAPQSDREKDIKTRYDSVKGSAVNPVLREGNSDRRAPRAVKEYARANPHHMGEWSADCKTHVAHMEAGDFYGSEQSLTLNDATSFTIEFQSEDGTSKVLRESAELLAGEVIDSSVMNFNALCSFLDREMADADKQNLLLSVHLKATMMKVSDPILFGHAVSRYFREVFEKYGERLKSLGVNPNNGVGQLLSLVNELPDNEKQPILDEIEACYKRRPDLAMVDSDNGITNLHVPSDVIIDASMPACIRNSGKMWGPDGELHETKALIPDRSYAGIYQEAIRFCRENGAFDPRTMGSVPNVGLMAQKAEEYGSHDKTFEIEAPGTVRVLDQNGKVLLENPVEKGDIWRMCQVKDAPVEDWVKLAVNRARETGVPTVFWLDPERAHDAELIRKVQHYLPTFDTEGLDIRIMTPVEACRFSMQRMKEGKDTISVTGNVLRDYLTDLFPILEVGTSAKMLSIVPLMNGGGMFETGAGGSAPRHVQQFVKDNHLRWDSLGEYLAVAASFAHFAKVHDNAQARVLSKTLDDATTRLLLENKSPKRGIGELDTRGSHFYLALYWAQALADQDDDSNLKAHYTPVAEALIRQEKTIVDELNGVQGKPVDIKGYYQPDPEVCSDAMRPSTTFNEVLEAI